MQNQSKESKIDVRIIVSGLNIAQYVSKAVNNIQGSKSYKMNMVMSIGMSMGESMSLDMSLNGDITYLNRMTVLTWKRRFPTRK